MCEYQVEYSRGVNRRGVSSLLWDPLLHAGVSCTYMTLLRALCADAISVIVAHVQADTRGRDPSVSSYNNAMARNDVRPLALVSKALNRALVEAKPGLRLAERRPEAALIIESGSERRRAWRVQELCLKEDGDGCSALPSLPWLRVLTFDCCSGIDHLHPAIARCGRLRSVVIISGQLSDLSALSGCGKLETLTLISCHRIRTLDLRSPSLKALDLYHCRSLEGLADTLAHCPSLSTLAFSEMPPSASLDAQKWLLGAQESKAIETLHLHNGHAHDMALVAACTSSLTALDLRLPRSVDLDECLRVLESCTELRRLTLRELPPRGPTPCTRTSEGAGCSAGRGSDQPKAVASAPTTEPSAAAPDAWGDVVMPPLPDRPCMLEVLCLADCRRLDLHSLAPLGLAEV